MPITVGHSSLLLAADIYRRYCKCLELLLFKILNYVEVLNERRLIPT